MPKMLKSRMNNVSMLLRAREIKSQRDRAVSVESGFLHQIGNGDTATFHKKSSRTDSLTYLHTKLINI